MEMTTAVLEARAAIARLDAQANRHLVDFAGRTMCWRSFGSGRPLVLVHGGHGSWLHWIRNIEALSQQYTLWLPDMPGYGDSETLAGEVDMDRLVEAFIATLDALVGADTEIGLAGFSFGGLVAARVAAQRQRVTRLALLGAAGHGGARRQRLDMVKWRRADDVHTIIAAMRHNLAALMLHDPYNIDAVALELHTVSCMRTRFRSKPISRAGGLVEILDAIAQPVLLLWGEHDVTAEPEAAARVLTEGHAKRRAHIVPGAGHWVQYERSHDVDRLLLGWFGGDHQ
jgi:pimeloyl-ACP methyl ester carboxylesterase